jgi:hypothetical protein
MAKHESGLQNSQSHLPETFCQYQLRSLGNVHSLINSGRISAKKLDLAWVILPNYHVRMT